MKKTTKDHEKDGGGPQEKTTKDQEKDDEGQGTRNRNGARKVEFYYATLYKIFNFSASGKIFEKAAPQTSDPAGRAPRVGS